jgi:hypothetical protein
MLGRKLRTTRTEVGLALAFAGVAYLVWALVAGISRGLVQEMIRSTRSVEVPALTRAVKLFFSDAGFVIDVLGLAWLVASLTLVYLSSRQKISISWAWVSAICQAFAAALGAVLVASAGYHVIMPRPLEGDTAFEQVSSISLGVTVVVAVVVWVSVLTALLLERHRYSRRRGPSLHDGLRTNVFR